MAVRLLPAVPCTVNKADIEDYYQKHCYMLTNRKEEDNYLDLKKEVNPKTGIHEFIPKVE